jgi:hypothetical protein
MHRGNELQRQASRIGLATVQDGSTVGTVETLHGCGLVDAKTDRLQQLSLKLYHGCDLPLGYQQSITEAPM